MAESASPTLEFSRSLYDVAAVEDAARAYAELATFEIAVTESQVTVAVRDPHPDVPDVADHFANHVLHTSVALARRALGGP